jgi:uncharacterized protein (TIGR02246 family)
VARRPEYSVAAVPLSSSDIDALRAAEEALVKSFEASDPTAWVDFYADDAIFVAPGGAAIEGRAALLAHARQMTPLSSARIVAQTTDGDGDMAAALGSASWVNGPRDSGGTTSRVRFLIVWRREVDGRWRLARELLNADV